MIRKPFVPLIRAIFLTVGAMIIPQSGIALSLSVSTEGGGHIGENGVVNFALIII